MWSMEHRAECELGWLQLPHTAFSSRHVDGTRASGCLAHLCCSDASAALCRWQAQVLCKSALRAIGQAAFGQHSAAAFGPGWAGLPRAASVSGPESALSVGPRLLAHSMSLDISSCNSQADQCFSFHINFSMLRSIDNT